LGNFVALSGSSDDNTFFPTNVRHPNRLNCDLEKVFKARFLKQGEQIVN